jgi:hypothetical protein
VWTQVPISLQKPRRLHLLHPLLLLQQLPSLQPHLPKKADPFLHPTAKSPVGNGGGFLR